MRFEGLASWPLFDGVRMPLIGNQRVAHQNAPRYRRMRVEVIVSDRGQDLERNRNWHGHR